MSQPEYIKLGPDMFVLADYQHQLEQLQLTDIDAVFAFEQGDQLTKANLGAHRSRIRFQLGTDGPFVYMKRYTNTPKLRQLRNWCQHGYKAAMSDFDRLPARELQQHSIHTPVTIAYGSQWQGGFEKRSFMIMTEIANADSLKNHLPDCMRDSTRPLSERKAFIKKLAGFVRRFHDTGFRHRDLYLCHIFMDTDQRLHLIDLHRAFKPGTLTTERYRLKDLTQLFYSSPGQFITRSDRLRFYQYYKGDTRLTVKDRRLFKRIQNKAWRMADHDIKHGRSVPFAQ